MDHVNSQNFVRIPFDTFRQMPAAKYEKYGIRFVAQEKSCTSQAFAPGGDFIPTWKEYADPHAKYVFAGGVLRRGLYSAADGTRLNADINGALNIARKCKQNERYPGFRLCMDVLDPPSGIRFLDRTGSLAKLPSPGYAGGRRNPLFRVRRQEGSGQSDAGFSKKLFCPEMFCVFRICAHSRSFQIFSYAQCNVLLEISLK